MIYVFLSILASTALLVIFKYFGKYKVNNLQAIVVNYFTASVLGFLFAGNSPFNAEIWTRPWVPYSALIGLLFISLFVILAISSQKAGLTVTSVANKMSMVIPVIAATFLYSEHIGWWKGAGIVLAVTGVLLSTSAAGGDSSSASKRAWIYPLIIFMGSGLSDTLLKYVEVNFLSTVSQEYFTAFLFGTAAVCGLGMLLFDLVVKKSKWEWRSLLWGILLGTPNYFSIHFLFLSLNKSGWGSTVVYPVNNMGIVVLSSVIGILIYKEHPGKKGIIGLLLALGAIALIASAE